MSSPASCPLLEIIIASDLVEARRVQAEIESALRSGQFAEQEIFAIRLALEEALVNAIKHGNQLDRAKAVRVSYRIHPDRFEVQVVDEGPGFDPEDVPDPTAPENLERPCGRGLLLMRHYMTEVAYHDRGRTVRMAKVRNGVK
jgi:serine/threonine-protein kinase RsbW